MHEFTIKLDEMVVIWLRHASLVTGESVEDLIAGGIYRQVVSLEDSIYSMFGVRESGE